MLAALEGAFEGAFVLVLVLVLVLAGAQRLSARHVAALVERSLEPENGAEEDRPGLPGGQNVTLDAGLRSLGTLTPLSVLNVTLVLGAKSLVTLTPLSVVNVTRELP
jgi:hypothetical protein